jgi:hypothetical protein
LGVSEDWVLKIKNDLGIMESRKMRWTGHIARMGEMRNAYKIVSREI